MNATQRAQKRWRRENGPRKHPDLTRLTCPCGGKATRFGYCVHCLDRPLARLTLQEHGIYLDSRKERREKAKGTR